MLSKTLKSTLIKTVPPILCPPSPLSFKCESMNIYYHVYNGINTSKSQCKGTPNNGALSLAETPLAARAVHESNSMSLIVLDCEVRLGPDARHVCRGNRCSVLSKTVVCLYSSDLKKKKKKKKTQTCSISCPISESNRGINLITLMRIACHVPTVCMRVG